ncbi:unnamed protein product [Lepeophtheirus salmonis]|uniref:(salmon louse) hypothetical protein n=1 Tax=Lepeophtheirus salmonis TaxID=72036 RepID=A0A7R8CYY4_LEPSM|nr:unnamed protein product [Lepeophtheirus salmonis]CAF2972337.1 unnamed protein product [Lepeophtheirus salmonis]
MRRVTNFLRVSSRMRIWQGLFSNKNWVNIMRAPSYFMKTWIRPLSGSPKHIYDARVTAGEIVQDDHQIKVLSDFEDLFHQLKAEETTYEVLPKEQSFWGIHLRRKIKLRACICGVP